jgi:hypothetical protein
MICRIEMLYERPMDIEWAYSVGQLYVLQARPITRYLPLAAEMVTGPGERRRLYVDAALSKGMTLNAPISPMGLSWMEDFNPEAVHRRRVEERRRAYEELISRVGWLRRMLLQRIHRIIELFAGTRDTPKYHIVLFNYAFRQRILIEGRHLVREGRLDALKTFSI